MDLKDKIRIVENFPKEGISFKDITTLIHDGEALKYAINSIADNLRDKNLDFIVGPEARGFIFGVPVACVLGVGFIPVRKKGKLPCDTFEIVYDLEYGEDVLEIHRDALKNGSRVAIVDDLLATGGTIKAVTDLIERAGGNVIELDFLIELEKIGGRNLLNGYEVKSLIKYDY